MFGEAFIDFYKRDEKLFETGFAELDMCVSGVTKGSLITIGARPAMGKSSFAISICNHLLDMGKKVLFCELDSSEQSTERLFISVKTKVRQPIAPVISKEKLWEEITKAIQFYQEKSFTLFCKVNMSIEELKSAYRTQAKSYHPDVLRAKGIPEDLIEIANAKMIKLNDAWAMICKERKL